MILTRGSPSLYQDKKRTLINVQWVVVIGTSYLALFNQDEIAADLPVLLLIAVLLASILGLQNLPQRFFDHRFFPHTLVVVNTALISLGISLNRGSPWDLFLILFFGLFVASIGEGLIQIVMGCLVLSIFFVFARPLPFHGAFPIETELLLRVPFLFGVFILYGYLADQFKQEKRRADQRQSVLYDFNAAMTSTLDLRTVLQLLLRKIAVHLPYAAATIRLVGDTPGILEPVACWNLDEQEWKREEGRSGRAPGDAAYEVRAPLMATNIRTHPRTRNPEFFAKHGLTSYLGVPLIAKGDVLGVLGFYTREKHEFSKEEIDFLATLAGLAAIAIQNSHLYNEMTTLAADLAVANKTKSEFLSVMSHELRTPLNVILGYSDMMKEKALGGINEEQEEALGKVISRTKDLLSMINSILQTARIEARAIQLETAEVRLTDLLDQVRSGYGPPMNKRLKLVWDYHDDLPVMTTDGEKLRQILENLISNAVKFTDEGRVTVSARVADGSVEFKVRDTGVGIPKEALPFIFDMFRQVDSSETRNYSGVGLGLYIVRKFTEMLGGTVSAESEPGKGSTFTVCVPVRARMSAGGRHEEKGPFS